jgi:hypothetical protein
MQSDYSMRTSVGTSTVPDPEKEPENEKKVKVEAEKPKLEDSSTVARAGARDGGRAWRVQGPYE